MTEEKPTIEKMLKAFDDSATSRGWRGWRKEFDAIRSIIEKRGDDWIARKDLAEFIAQHQKDLCLTPLCPKRLEAGAAPAPKVVTRGQVDAAIEKFEHDGPDPFSHDSAGVIRISDIPAMLAALGFVIVEKEKKP